MWTTPTAGRMSTEGVRRVAQVERDVVLPHLRARLDAVDMERGMLRARLDEVDVERGRLVKDISNIMRRISASEG